MQISKELEKNAKRGRRLRRHIGADLTCHWLLRFAAGGGSTSPRGGHRRPPLCRVQLWKEDLCLADLVDFVDLVDLVDLCLAGSDDHKDILRRIFSEELF